MTHNLQNLQAHILPLSKAKDFNDAVKEWEWTGSDLDEGMDECPCGQAIKEICYIHNRVTGQSTHVGNVCINRFMHIPTGRLFDGIRRILRDEEAAPNSDLVTQAFSWGYITGSEQDFLFDTMCKRILSGKQLNWRVSINKRILSRLNRRGSRSVSPSALPTVDGAFDERVYRTF